MNRKNIGVRCINTMKRIRCCDAHRLQIRVEYRVLHTHHLHFWFRCIFCINYYGQFRLAFHHYYSGESVFFFVLLFFNLMLLHLCRKSILSKHIQTTADAHYINESRMDKIRGKRYIGLVGTLQLVS